MIHAGLVLAKEAVMYEQLPDKRVRCTACARYCNIPEGKIGLCGIRGNVGGRLELFAYGKVITGHVDPIEKKPVSHYMPGSKVFSIATTGCNWLCQYCQNFDISQRRKVEGTTVTPEKVVQMTLNYDCQGLAYTYNEPTIFIEFAHDVGVIAREKGIFNLFVSNGYGTPETVRLLGEFLDCMTVDFKGSGEVSFIKRYIGVPSPEPIYEYLLEIKEKAKIHIEITDLIVPEIGDDLKSAEKLCAWVYDHLSPEIPVHFLRFHPDYRLMHIPQTPVVTLEQHHAVGKKVGLKYVYVGNVPGHPLEHTYCPGCGKIVVRRLGYDILGWNLDKHNRCAACGYQISIEGTLSKTVQENRFVSVI